MERQVVLFSVTEKVGGGSYSLVTDNDISLEIDQECIKLYSLKCDSNSQK